MHDKIVDTRKYNKDKRAKLGRRGDTEIRKIDGKPSHVNALEATLIDMDKKFGEKYAKDVGAGTINPYTGLKEYNPEYLGGMGTGEQFEMMQDMYDMQGTNTNRYEGMSFNEMQDALVEFGVTDQDKWKYITGFEQRPYDFIQQEYDLNQKQSQIDYDKLDVRKDSLDVQRDQLAETKSFADENLRNVFTDTSMALGRQYRAGAKGALGQSQAMQARSGLASSGGAQYGMQTQLKELAKGQAEGMDTARRNLDFGTEKAQSAYDFGIKGLDLDTRTLGADYAGVSLGKYKDTLSYEKAMYGEGRRQEDRFYDEIAALESVK